MWGKRIEQAEKIHAELMERFNKHPSVENLKLEREAWLHLTELKEQFLHWK